MDTVDPAWLPPGAWRAIGRRRIRVTGSGLLVETVAEELRHACGRFGGDVVRGAGGPPCDLEMSLDGDAALGDEGYEVAGDDTRTVLRAARPHGLLYGMFHLLRSGGTLAASPNGVLGDPAGASADEGEAMLAELAGRLRERLGRWAPDRIGHLA